MQVVVAIEGLSVLNDLDVIPKEISRAAVRAINGSAAKARTLFARAMREQISFPASYLAPAGGRLKVVGKASAGNMVATIKGRDAPTSLARFSRDTPAKVKKAKGVSVMVQPGVVKFINRAWLITLRNGNRGLAVRTDGAPPRGAFRPKRIPNTNIWLLYGPSVDQVLYSVRNETGVYTDLTQEVAAHLEKEFLRLLDVDFDK